MWKTEAGRPCTVAGADTIFLLLRGARCVFIRGENERERKKIIVKRLSSSFAAAAVGRPFVAGRSSSVRRTPDVGIDHFFFFFRVSTFDFS